MWWKKNWKRKRFSWWKWCHRWKRIPRKELLLLPCFGPELSLLCFSGVEKTFAHHWETIKIKSNEANRYRHTVVKIQWCSISSMIEFFRVCFRHFKKFYTCDIFCTWKRTHLKLQREKISKFHWNWTSKLFFYEFSAMLWTTSPFQNFDGRANVFSGVLYCYN